MKVLILTVLAAGMAVGVSAQKVDEKDIPQGAKDALVKGYGIKAAEWNKEDNNFEASFKKSGKEQSVVFDGSGNVIETEIEIGKNELPAFVLDVLKKEYADFKIEEIAKIESKEGKFFEVEVEKKEETYELIFDNQKLVKKTRETEDEDKD